MVLSWAITAIFALLLVNIPVSVGMWYAGDAARVFFQQVGSRESIILMHTPTSHVHHLLQCRICFYKHSKPFASAVDNIHLA